MKTSPYLYQHLDKIRTCAAKVVDGQRFEPWLDSLLFSNLPLRSTNISSDLLQVGFGAMLYVRFQ